MRILALCSLQLLPEPVRHGAGEGGVDGVTAVGAAPLCAGVVVLVVRGTSTVVGGRRRLRGQREDRAPAVRAALAEEGGGEAPALGDVPAPVAAAVYERPAKLPPPRPGALLAERARSHRGPRQLLPARDLDGRADRHPEEAGAARADVGGVAVMAAVFAVAVVRAPRT